MEIGHGPGHLQVALHEREILAVAVDSSLQMNHKAHKLLLKKNFVSQIINGTCKHLPFGNETYPYVVSTFPTDFIFDPESLQEIRRTLTTNGSLIVLPFAWISGDTCIHRLFAWIYRLTNQAPVWDNSFTAPFIQAGFKVKTHINDFESSKTLVVIAIKS